MRITRVECAIIIFAIVLLFVCLFGQAEAAPVYKLRLNFDCQGHVCRDVCAPHKNCHPQDPGFWDRDAYTGEIKLYPTRDECLAVGKSWTTFGHNQNDKIKSATCSVGTLDHVR